MEILIIVACVAAGYAFRGASGKKRKVIGADIKAKLAKIGARLPKR